MYLFTRSLKAGRHRVEAACERLGHQFPALMRHAIILAVPVPGILQRLDGRLGAYAMCLNHWLRFLPVPVILLNAEWFTDEENLRHRYVHDVKTGYHPDCSCPARYIVAHEAGHFIYTRLNWKERERWERIFEAGKPSGYSTTPEESFCEAFAGGIACLEGPYFKLAAALARGHRTKVEITTSNGRRSAQPPTRL